MSRKIRPDRPAQCSDGSRPHHCGIPAKKSWWGAPSTQGRAKLGPNKFDEAVNFVCKSVS